MSARDEGLARRLLPQADPTMVPASRLKRRSGGTVRALTIPMSPERGGMTALDAGRRMYPHDPTAPTRPRTWGECQAFGLGTTHRCPHVSCRWHLYLDVHPVTGGLKLNFPHLEVWELEESCALAVAARGRLVPRRVGSVLNLTHQMVRKYETATLAKLRDGAEGLR